MIQLLYTKIVSTQVIYEYYHVWYAAMKPPANWGTQKVCTSFSHVCLNYQYVLYLQLNRCKLSYFPTQAPSISSMRSDDSNSIYADISKHTNLGDPMGLPKLYNWWA